MNGTIKESGMDLREFVSILALLALLAAWAWIDSGDTDTPPVSSMRQQHYVSLWSDKSLVSSQLAPEHR